VPTPPPSLDAATHRAMGVGLYNRTWELLEIANRTKAQDDELVDTAHASAWHWRQVGNAANAARSHWLCARVYAVLERGEPAAHHAARAVALVEAGGDGFEAWDAAAAAEAMTRALRVQGDRDGAARWRERTTALLAVIEGADDREVIERDLTQIPT